jgi:Esterase/lipase
MDLFRTRDHVPDFDVYVGAYRERSAATRARCRAELDVPYGSGEFERLDLFFPEGEVRAAPVHLFIHGGYWRMFDKSDFSFVADTVVGAGGVAAILNYSLMPAVRMETVVRQVRAAAAWLQERAAAFGGDPQNLTISGHSAGGHLCAFLLDTDSPVRPRGALMLSGIYELAPLQRSFLQPEIGITDEEVHRFSPLRLAYQPSGPAILMAGERETAPFHEQGQAMAATLRRDGVKAAFHSIPGANHMSIVLDLGDSGTGPGQALASLMKQEA